MSDLDRQESEAFYAARCLRHRRRLDACVPCLAAVLAPLAAPLGHDPMEIASEIILDRRQAAE